MDATANFRLDQELLDLVDEHAARNRRTRSNQLRIIVEDWLMDWAEDHLIESAPARVRQTAEEFIAGKPAGSMLVDTQAEYDASHGRTS